MKALIKTRKAKGLELQEVPEPLIQDDEVLIKIKWCSICGTDLHIYEWDHVANNTISPPLIIGHEFMGEIVRVGKNVRHLKLGERVSGEGHLSCGFCRNCLTGKKHLCFNVMGIGINRNGAFAEYLALPASNVIPIPDSISDEVGTILDPLGNAVHTALAFDLVGEDVLITGVGSIGMMACAVAKFVAARHIVVTDINENHLKMAEKLGATLGINVAKHSFQEACLHSKIPFEFTVGLEMSGSQNALNTLVEALYPGGRIAMLGLFSKEEGSSTPWNNIIFKGLTLKGIYGRKMFETWHKMLALLDMGLDVSPIITHRFAIKEYEKAFELQAKGQAGKILLHW